MSIPHKKYCDLIFGRFHNEVQKPEFNYDYDKCFHTLLMFWDVLAKRRESYKNCEEIVEIENLYREKAENLLIKNEE